MGQNPPPRPPALGAVGAAALKAASACEPHRTWIEAQVQLGRNAQSIYQDLVEQHGFRQPLQLGQAFRQTAQGSGSRSASTCWSTCPAEEAQVDYGQGAPTLYKAGKYRRPYLFVMTLKFSGKSFRKTVWKTDQETWARLHEEAWRSFGGCCQYVVLDNLKAGVIQPGHLRAGTEPGLRRDAARTTAWWPIPAGSGSESQGHRRERDPAHAGHRAEGAQVRVDRGAERLARALGGALGGAAHPRPQEAPGAGDVPRGAAAPASRCRWRGSATSSRARAPSTTRAWCRSTGVVLRGAAGAAAQRGPVRIYAREIEILRRLRPAAAPARERRRARASSCSKRGIGSSTPRARPPACSAKAGKIGPQTAAARPHALRPPRPPRPEGALRPDQPAAHLPPRRDRGGLRPLPRRRLRLVRRRPARPRAAGCHGRRPSPAISPRRVRPSGPSPSTNRSGRRTPRPTRGGRPDAHVHR